MKRFLALFITVLTFSAFLFVSCEKENTEEPSIVFIEELPYAWNDTTLAVGDSIKIGLRASWNGTDNLTNFQVKNNDEVVIDQGINVKDYHVELTLVKNLSQTEDWVFIVRDKEGGIASAHLTVTLDSTSVFGQVISYESITLGAQNQSAAGNFFSLGSGTVYNLASAFQNQTEIDLCYYYEEGDENVIASPGANISDGIFPGSHSMNFWTVRRTSRFIETQLTVEEFDQVANDSILIANYSDADGKRKAKSLKAGDVYSFKTESNKIGLIKVLNVEGTDGGTVEFALKAQI